MTHWNLTSVKGNWKFEGTKDGAIWLAKELQAEYQAAFGVAVEDEDGRAYYNGDAAYARDFQGGDIEALRIAGN